MTAAVPGARRADALRIAMTCVGVASLAVVNALAYASFLATGKLAAMLPTVGASSLLSSALMSIVLVRRHSMPTALGGPAGNAAAVVGATLAAVVAHESSATIRPADIAVVLSLTALLPGVTMLVLAYLRLGSVIRFVPYPVFAGFLAGTGWLLVSGSLRIAGAPGPIAVAGVCVIAMRFAQQRSSSPFLIPAASALAAAAIYAGLAVAHVSIGEARADHWLYDALPAAGPAFLSPAALLQANWGAIVSAWSAFVWVVVVVMLCSMMNGATLEAESGIDTDVDRDMAAVGTANLVTGLFGGFGSQIVLPSSVAATRLAAGSRLPAYVVTGFCVAAMCVAGAALPYVPRAIPAAIIALIGLRLLEQYIVSEARLMPRSEAATVIGMLLCSAVVGLAPALVLGLIVSCVTFAANAGQQRVVRSTVTLRTLRSRVVRTPAQRLFLDRFGDAVEIVRLQGQLFFGVATRLYDAVAPIVLAQPPKAMIILDFGDVHGIDTSAARTFDKIARAARRSGTALVFANVTASTVRVLGQSGACAAGVEAFARLADALEFGETRFLERAEPLDDADGPYALAETDTDVLARLAGYFEPLSVAAGAILFAQGGPSDSLYVLESGRLLVERDGVLLRTLIAGALAGEIGFFTGAPRSATATAVEDSVVNRLSRQAMLRIEQADPRLLAAFVRTIVRLQADRLRRMSGFVPAEAAVLDRSPADIA